MFQAEKNRRKILVMWFVGVSMLPWVCWVVVKGVSSKVVRFVMVKSGEVRRPSCCCGVMGVESG